VLATYRIMGCSLQYIKWLLHYVSIGLGGVPEPSNEEIKMFETQSEAHQQQLRDESSEHIISLGRAHMGLCKYRTLLFKYLVCASAYVVSICSYIK
jgi:hypothetical protein